MDELLNLLRLHRAELPCSFHLVVDGAQWYADRTSGAVEVDRPMEADCRITLTGGAVTALLARPTKGTVLSLALQRKLSATPVEPAIQLATLLAAWRQAPA